MNVPPIIKRNKPHTESALEALLVKKVISIGGTSFKFISPQMRGVSDRIVIISSTVFFVELKTVTGKISKHQHNFKRIIDCHSCNHRFVIGIKGVNDFIKELEDIHAKP
jgi:hypothetical protein